MSYVAVSIMKSMVLRGFELLINRKIIYHVNRVDVMCVRSFG